MVNTYQNSNALIFKSDKLQKVQQNQPQIVLELTKVVQFGFQSSIKS